MGWPLCFTGTRATGDVDLLVDFAAGEVTRTLGALEHAGFQPYVPVPASDFAPDREALLRTTLALTVDERLAWLEQMMSIALDSGALPKAVPDQLAGARNTAVD